VHNWNTFGVRMNHGHTRIHKIHHNLNLQEAITFPIIIIFYDLPRGLHPNGDFLELQAGSPTILKIGTPVTLDAHNFLCIPMIESRFKEIF